MDKSRFPEIHLRPARDEAALRHFIFPTALGNFCLELKGRRLAGLRFPSDITVRCRSERVRLSTEQKRASASAVNCLKRYFRGERVSFGRVTIDDDWMTPFEKLVLKGLLRIPYGQVLSYGELASRIGHPEAARAVGNALRKNRLPVIFPCHRVVLASGALGGYSPGVSWKKRLLEMEESKAFCRRKVIARRPSPKRSF